MTDRVLLSAGQHNIRECIDLAITHDLGIEVVAFSDPDVLDGDWRTLLRSYRQLLRPLPGLRSLHGPFMDMSPGSPDKRMRGVCSDRYRHAIRIAAELDAAHIIFHANFIAAIRNSDYRQSWHEHNVEFWNATAAYAQEHGVTIAVENMWEFDPHIIGDVLKAVDHPRLRACLDAGHAHLFSDAAHTFEDWLRTLEPWLIHMHLNNNDGATDAHRSLHDGVLDYGQILRRIRALPQPPCITLEMDAVSDMAGSLSFFGLKRSTGEQPAANA